MLVFISIFRYTLQKGVTGFDPRTVKFYDDDKAYDIEFAAALQDGKKVAYAKRFFGYDAELTKNRPPKLEVTSPH